MDEITSKYVKDPIHGDILLTWEAQAVVDTEEFQRLRYLKQLGAASFVYPGATHSRFEHSLGVYHLSNKYINQIKRQNPEVEVNDKDIRNVGIAGLCHDLGHGPFSHLFDNLFMKAVKPDLKWSHEDASVMLFQELVNKNGLKFDDDDIKMIQDLIRGEPTSGQRDDGRKFLFEIVANKSTNIDVDKFDYLIRDSHAVGMKFDYDYNRLMTFSRVIGNEICYAYKTHPDIRALFQLRYDMHERVYQHRAAKACEFMLVDAMIAADKVLGISSSIAENDMKRYKFLNDSIINEIERSLDPKLDAARNIIKRIRQRKLYKCIDSFIFPPELGLLLTESHLTPDKFLSHRQDAEMIITESDFKLDLVRISFTKKDQNPLKDVKFFNSKAEKPWLAQNLPEDQMSSVLPRSFQQTSVRVYYTGYDSDRTKKNALFVMYHRLLNHLLGTLDPENPYVAVEAPDVPTRENRLIAKSKKEAQSVRCDLIAAQITPVKQIFSSLPTHATPRRESNQLSLKSASKTTLGVRGIDLSDDALLKATNTPSKVLSQQRQNCDDSDVFGQFDSPSGSTKKRKMSTRV